MGETETDVPNMDPEDMYLQDLPQIHLRLLDTCTLFIDITRASTHLKSIIAAPLI